MRPAAVRARCICGDANVSREGGFRFSVSVSGCVCLCLSVSAFMSVSVSSDARVCRVRVLARVHLFVGV